MTNKMKYWWFGGLGAILLMISLQACDLRSFVKVDVPAPVLEATGNEAPVTLDETESLRQDWEHYVLTNTKRLDDATEAAEARYAVIHQIVSVGLDTASTASSGIPYGGILFGALTGLTGLCLPQPKFVKKKE